MRREHGIVLLHGAGLGSWIWERVIPHLPAPVLAIDLPGRAGVERPDGLDLEACARRVHAQIDALAASSVTLVAHSVTGSLALSVAAREGTKVTSLVFVGAVVPPPGGAYVDALPWMSRTILKALYFFKPRGLKPPPAMLRKALCNDLDEATSELVEERSVVELPALFLDSSEWQALPDTTRRTYVKLRADTSDVTPALQERMAQRVGAERSVELDSGHLPMLSQPQALAEIIAQA